MIGTGGGVGLLLLTLCPSTTPSCRNGSRGPTVRRATHPTRRCSPRRHLRRTTPITRRPVRVSRPNPCHGPHRATKAGSPHRPCSGTRFRKAPRMRACPSECPGGNCCPARPRRGPRRRSRLLVTKDRCGLVPRKPCAAACPVSSMGWSADGTLPRSTPKKPTRMRAPTTTNDRRQPSECPARWHQMITRLWNSRSLQWLALNEDDFPNPASGREPVRVVCDARAGQDAPRPTRTATSAHKQQSNNIRTCR